MTTNTTETFGEQVIAHFGVKGMRWGVRKDDSSGGGAAGGVTKVKGIRREKPTSSQIHGARTRLGAQKRQINRQIDKTNLATGKQLDKEAKKLADLHAAYLRNPDRATAARMTSGEKFALAGLALFVPGVGTTVAGISAGSRLIGQRAVERDLNRRGVRR